MKPSCKGYCSHFGRVGGTAKYGFGEKRCNPCECVFPVEFIGVHCPCCGHKLKFSNNQAAYREDNYSGSYLTQLTKKRQCAWCKSFVSKFAAHRIYGKPTDPTARIEFYQEWRTDRLGNQVCHDCWMTGRSIDTLDENIANFAKRLNELEIDIPKNFNIRIQQILALYPAKVEENPFLALSS